MVEVSAYFLPLHLEGLGNSDVTMPSDKKGEGTSTHPVQALSGSALNCFQEQGRGS